ncbi:hypothetical protein K9U40_09480 [Xanthobacter autotrophicus]|uniref:hypothetical protein n=1 Tax=Xanthobacter TaxID=279 RepID=UPI0024AB603F|nr:hypothetical protein [Xanthobacter autotrophicus]MDI4664553.1 hypothetical protein [Xanthobacter autotrophicus]
MMIVKAARTFGLGSALLGGVMGMLLSAAPAHADKAAAERCAAKLSPEAKAIYAASFPLLVPGADGRAVVTEQTRSLVLSGKIAHTKATESAQAAAGCLVLR